MAEDPPREAMGQESKSAAEEVRNMILVSCFIGRIRNIPIPNAFLERSSKHAKKTYYKVRDELSKDGLINITGEHKRERIELTEEGIRMLSKILTGKEREHLEWAHVRDAMRQEVWIFWAPIMCIEESTRRDLLQALLLLYSESPGNNPKSYYIKLLNNLVTDYRNRGASGLKENLLEKLARFYTASSDISRTQERDYKWANVLSIFLQFVSALLGKIDEVCLKAEIALGLAARERTTYILRRRTTYLLCPIITSLGTIIKNRLVPLYLALISDILLLILASAQPATGLFLAYVMIYIGYIFGGSLIVIFLVGVIGLTIVTYRTSKEKSRA